MQSPHKGERRALSMNTLSLSHSVLKVSLFVMTVMHQSDIIWRENNVMTIINNMIKHSDERYKKEKKSQGSYFTTHPQGHQEKKNTVLLKSHKGRQSYSNSVLSHINQKTLPTGLTVQRPTLAYIAPSPHLWHDWGDTNVFESHLFSGTLVCICSYKTELCLSFFYLSLMMILMMPVGLITIIIIEMMEREGKKEVCK